jgi:hypothetical protein
MSEELKPCPFCGGAARIESNRDWHRLYANHSDDCVFDADDHALMYPAQPGYLIEIAEVWNCRATPPAPSTTGGSMLQQPFAGAITLLETIAQYGMTPEVDGKPTPNKELCLRFASEMRAALAAKPAG